MGLKTARRSLEHSLGRMLQEAHRDPLEHSEAEEAAWGTADAREAARIELPEEHLPPSLPVCTAPRGASRRKQPRWSARAAGPVWRGGAAPDTRRGELCQTMRDRICAGTNRAE